MQFFDCITEAKNKNQSGHTPCIFYGSSHNTQWIETVKDILGKSLSFHSINSDEVSPQVFLQQISISSFFTTSSVYYLDLWAVSSSIRREWIAILEKKNDSIFVYSCILADDVRYYNSFITVQVPVLITLEQAHFLSIHMYGVASDKIDYFLTMIYKRKSVYFLEDIWRLLSYIYLIHATNIDAFIYTWVPQLIREDNSLFQLSGAFLAKNKKQFMLLWQNMVTVYQPIFWTTYWSDQLWRAALFVKYMRVRDVVRAKEIQNKLPFSFIKQDWQKYTYQELVDFHALLYMVDYSLKNGGHIHQLEQIFITELFKS